MSNSWPNNPVSTKSGEDSVASEAIAAAGLRRSKSLYVRLTPSQPSETIARVRLPDGAIRLAELHWYEAHGIGRKDLKIKRLIRSL